MRRIGIYIICITLFCVINCRQAYEPPVIKSNNNFLVVDGIILNGQDSSIIKLSRTRNLSDTAKSIPELQAQVTVVGESGENFPFIDQGNGRYAVDQLNLNNSEKYQLKIITSSGTEYLSDKLSVNQTPAIDSVNWRQDSAGVRVYVTTHDPQAQTKFYRWQYIETWQYHAWFDSFFDLVDGNVVLRPIDRHIYNCWISAASSNILVATSNKLSSDLIFENPVAAVPTGSEKLSVKYSIIVKQYAISEQSYNFWFNLKKNTEQLGSLFDAQPSQLVGNVHSTINPDEPVLGFVDLATQQSQRIFIDAKLLQNWNYVAYYGQDCYDKTVPPDSGNYYLPQTGHRFWVLEGTDISRNYIITPIVCGDCRDHGGTNIKPSFWQ
ncbi:MAG: DUF4249 domain-containing protein [Bacteroidetes bacterium]|nr:DUF4249 domain-containing protein [Bacteroidota bacterium]